MSIRNAQDYFESHLANAHASDRLWVVLDPERRLNLPEAVYVAGRTWRVYRYAENDLDFRARYGRGPNDPNLPHIIWVTPSPFRREPAVTFDLSFLPDVLRRAAPVLDVSLGGMLHALIRAEVFPDSALRAYGDILGDHLDLVVSAHRELRRTISNREPLSLPYLRALALHCLQPDLPLADCLFTQTTEREMLHHYLRVVWSGQIGEAALPLLQEQAASAPWVANTTLKPWFAAAPDDLAMLIYVYRALKAYRVPHPLNHLRGLGVVALDPAPLEPYLNVAVQLWDDADVRVSLLHRAEAGLSPDKVTALAALFDLSQDALLEALRQEVAPALVYGLAERQLLAWARNNDLSLLPLATEVTAVSSLPQTAYTARAEAALTLRQELTFIAARLAALTPLASDLATFVDSYVQSGAYRLELACAIASTQAQKFATQAARQTLAAFIAEVRRRIWDYLDTLDSHLAHLIGLDGAGLAGHPRLATQVVPDLALRSAPSPTPERALWVVIFDGMRWDSWKEVALPALLQVFEIADGGKVYLSLLPSFTAIARTGLLAGAPPQQWRAANGQVTTNESILLARLFDLDQADRDRLLRVETKSERSAVQQRLLADPDRKPINVLIYNLSDTWIHEFQGDLAALNDHIAQDMQRIVADLQTLVGDEDALIVSSDHGFVELDPDAGTLVYGDAQHVFYRYLIDLAYPQCPQVAGPKGETYTLAQGRAWFRREGGAPTRYTHGGISLAEMVVPGVRLQKIVTPSVKLALVGAPQRLDVREKEPCDVHITLQNTGNRPTTYTLTWQLDTTSQANTIQGTLGPRENRVHAYTFTPVYSPRPTTRLTVTIGYEDVDRRQKTMPVHVIPITTEPRTDVVEIDFGGLDKLDNL